MPNNTHNIIKFKNLEDLKKVEFLLRRDDVKTFWEKGYDEFIFDFNPLIPEPKTIEECPEKFILKGNNFEITPRKDRPWYNWYDWRRANWNTKWYSYDCYIDEKKKIIGFSTAWNAPYPVFDALAKKYLDMAFTITCSFEDDEYKRKEVFKKKPGKPLDFGE